MFISFNCFGVIQCWGILNWYERRLIVVVSAAVKSLELILSIGVFARGCIEQVLMIVLGLVVFGMSVVHCGF